MTQPTALLAKTDTVPSLFPSNTGPDYITRSNDLHLVRLSEPSVWQEYQELITEIMEGDKVCYGCRELPFPNLIEGLVGVHEDGNFQNYSYKNFFAIVKKTTGVKQHYLYKIKNTKNYFIFIKFFINFITLFLNLFSPHTIFNFDFIFL